MTNPPPGYDDESVIHKSHLKFILEDFEKELVEISHLFEKEQLPINFENSIALETSFLAFKQAALELGADYTFLIDKIHLDYKQFQENPSQEALSKIFADVKSLQLELIQV